MIFTLRRTDCAPKVVCCRVPCWTTEDWSERRHDLSNLRLDHYSYHLTLALFAPGTVSTALSTSLPHQTLPFPSFDCMKKVFVCIASLANLSETSSFANMNSEMAKIRRERWLKSKCNDQDNRRSPALESQSWLEDLNSSNVAKVNDTSVTHETKNTNDRSLLKKSPGFKVECIDLFIMQKCPPIILYNARGKSLR